MRGQSGSETCAMQTLLVDQLVEHLFRNVLQGELVALVAIGGYGRREMAPHSDVELLLLCREPEVLDASDRFMAAVVQPLLALNLKVSPRVLTPDEGIQKANADFFFKNALLDARWLCGDNTLYAQFDRSFRTHCQHRLPYLQQCFEEQKKRRERQQNTVFLLEPNIKEGLGALRDYEYMLYRARICRNWHYLSELHEHGLLDSAQYETLQAAHDFLLKLRSVLQGASQRANDVLYTEYKADVAIILGYTEEEDWPRMEHLMRDYYHHASQVYNLVAHVEARLYSPLKTARHIFKSLATRITGSQMFDGFVVQDGTLQALNDSIFTEDPLRLIRVFRYAQGWRLSMGVALKALIHGSLDRIDEQLIHSLAAGECFTAILADTGHVFNALQAMFDCGVLARFVPEFGKLVALTQREHYHRYTADVHTLLAIRAADSIFSINPPENYRAVLQACEDVNLLYWMLLLHDLGKGSGSSHVLAFRVLQRSGLNAYQREQVLFVAQNPRLMIQYWQKHDPNDAAAVETFAKTVKTLDTLRFLYALSYCDAQATGSTLWNVHKQLLHQQCFDRVFEFFRQHPPALSFETERSTLQAEVMERLASRLTAGPITAHFEQTPHCYCLQNNLDTLVAHIELVEQQRQAGTRTVFQVHYDKNTHVCRLEVVSRDPHSLPNLSTALATHDIRVRKLQVTRRTDGLFLFTFLLDIGQQKPAAFTQKLTGLLTTPQNPFKKPTRRSSSFSPKVDIYHTDTHTRVEIEAADRTGLLAEASRTLEAAGFQITYGKASSDGCWAHGVFYIESEYQSTSASILVSLQKTLCIALMY
ncbi:MAG: hypothetical protein A2Y14_02355 [Verrucomicrobia bacterium GWF2_51_19]|nr:MAG: hypothetical protein A2Y14_02355 [Verrucomicrobia bacterium GWF2_51_19]